MELEGTTAKVGDPMERCDEEGRLKAHRPPAGPVINFDPLVL
jgi:hypothetical protein